MKNEKLQALTFIVVGCIGAVALGFIVWQASSPDRPTPDIAMHTTPSTSPAPVLFEDPGEELVSDPDPERTRQTLAAVDTADPYLAPNAYVPSRARGNQTKPVDADEITPVAGPRQSATTTRPSSPTTVHTSTVESPSTNSPRPPETGESGTRTPAPPLPDLPTVPPVTAPPVTVPPVTEDDEDTEDPEDTTPVFPADPSEPTDPTDPVTEQPTIDPLPEDTGTPDESPEPTPTDFVDEPTAPLNPETPVDTTP